MSLHYCWPTRALNSFCVTEFINLPSLHSWQALLESRPCSQGKQLAGSCLLTSQELEQWTGVGGWPILGNPQNMKDLAEVVGTVCGVVILRCGSKGTQAHRSTDVLVG